MDEAIQTVSELRSVLTAQLDQLTTGRLVVTRTTGGREDRTNELIAELKKVLAFVSRPSMSSGSDHVDQHSALGGPSYERVRE